MKLDNIRLDLEKMCKEEEKAALKETVLHEMYMRVVNDANKMSLKELVLAYKLFFEE